jgi:hypothetical protein
MLISFSSVLQNVTEYGAEFCGQWRNIVGSNKIIKFLPDVSSGFWRMTCSEIVVFVNLPRMKEKLSMPATDTEIKTEVRNVWLTVIAYHT